ncbi:hypothetical protein Hanom_Chr13g01240281 [Helianthus anomalus]
MRQLRIESTMLACAVHEDMDPNNYLQFDKIRDFPHPTISLEVWRELCMVSELAPSFLIIISLCSCVIMLILL